MDRLQKAKFAIDRAETTSSRENAMLNTQLAIANALFAIAERMDKMIRTQELALEHSEDLYALPGN